VNARFVASVSASLRALSCASPIASPVPCPTPEPSRLIIVSPACTRMRIPDRVGACLHRAPLVFPDALRCDGLAIPTIEAENTLREDYSVLFVAAPALVATLAKVHVEGPPGGAPGLLRQAQAPHYR